MSNTGELAASWRRALEGLAAAVLSYYESVAAEGFGGDEPPAEARAAAESAGRLPPPPGEGPGLAGRALDFIEAHAAAAAALHRQAAAALDTRLWLKAASHQSGARYDETAARRRRLAAADGRARREARLAWEGLARAWAPDIAAAPAAEGAVLVRGLRGGRAGWEPAAALCAEAFRLGSFPAALVEEAKNAALGLPPETPALVAEAREARAAMHPLQAVAFTYGLRPSGPSAAERAAAVADFTLPQASAAVRYDAAPLFDRDAAEEFGPLGGGSQGVSYRALRRFCTIREDPLPAARPPPTIRRLPGGQAGAERGGVARTIDAGLSLQAFERGGEALPPDAALAAGPLPRNAALACSVEAAALPAGRPAAGGTAAGLLDRFEAWGARAPPPYTPALLLQHLLRAFRRAFSGAPLVASEGEFQAFLLGKADSHASYIADAVAAACPGPAAGAAGREERALADLLAAYNTVEAIAARLARAYSGSSAQEAAAALFAEKGLPPAARAAEALGIFKKVAVGALGRETAIADKGRPLLPPPSVKKFLLGRAFRRKDPAL